MSRPFNGQFSRVNCPILLCVRSESGFCHEGHEAVDSPRSADVIHVVSLRREKESRAAERIEEEEKKGSKNKRAASGRIIIVPAKIRENKNIT